jgi:hypothetical protein
MGRARSIAILVREGRDAQLTGIRKAVACQAVDEVFERIQFLDGRVVLGMTGCGAGVHVRTGKSVVEETATRITGLDGPTSGRSKTLETHHQTIDGV